MCANALARPEQTPFPHHAYHAAVDVGIRAAKAWYRAANQSLGEFRDAERAEYAGYIIDAHEPGRIPLGAALDGFTDGFSRGLAQIISGGANHG